MKVVIVSCLLAMLMALVSAQPNLNGGVAVTVNATQMAQKIVSTLSTILNLPATVLSSIIPILTQIPTSILHAFSFFLSIVQSFFPVSVASVTCAPCTPGGVCIGGCASLNVNR